MKHGNCVWFVEFPECLSFCGIVKFHFKNQCTMWLRFSASNGILPFSVSDVLYKCMEIPDDSNEFGAKEDEVKDSKIIRPKPSNMDQFFPKAAITAKSRYSNSAENAADVILEHRSIIQDSGEALISRNSGRRILITLHDSKGFQIWFLNTAVQKHSLGFQ
ncbi:hypothetical protein CEXT_291581 [Caerostris extrusa]|uniref:Uncharacterized protein n=1 Tax=Caerostris extrusa TaxID=172846 RepID=A0AAV4W5B7_CAEEX|nr:hypothetical protein CEXT_291581 [Caerostris extrusa]